MEELIELLAQPTWRHLDTRLRAAIARDPANAPMVDVIRAPVTTLQLLMRDAVKMFRGDPLAAERLRATLHAASDAAALVPVAREELKQLGPDAHAEPQPGLIRLRALAVVLAAARFAHPEPERAAFALEAIAGLALQCWPVELLARLEPFGAPDDTYDNLLRLTAPPIVASGMASRVLLFNHARDPVERARWRCILKVLALLAPKAKGEDRWSIATDDGIDRVDIAPGGHVALFGVQLAQSFDPHKNAVVGVTETGGVIAAKETTPTTTGLAATFERDVLWVGLVERAAVPQVNKTREGLRAALAKVAHDACTIGEPAIDFAHLFPSLPTDHWPLTDVPPRTRATQPPVEPPLVAPAAPPAATPAPGPVPAGPPKQPPMMLVPGASASPNEPDVDATTGQRRLSIVVLPVSAIDTNADGKLVARSIDPSQVERSIAAIGDRLGVPLDVMTVPWVEDAARVVSSLPTDDDDPRVTGLVEAIARAAARTPGREHALWLGILPGPGEIAVATTADAALAIGVATLRGLPAFIARALRPDPAPTLDAIATTPVAYVSANRMAGRLADRAVPLKVRAPSARLRVIGRFTPTGAIDLFEPPREEPRGAGLGAPVDTGVVAVAIDSSGGELARSPIRAHRATGGAAFAALVPLAPDVEIVELRRDRNVLARIERERTAPDKPELELTTDEDGAITAVWTAPTAARSVALTVEISDRGGDDDDDLRPEAAWVPITELHACAEKSELPLWRLPPAESLRVRIVACDGWNATASDPARVPGDARFGPCVIRRVNDRTLWAEIGPEDEPDWTTKLPHVEIDRRLELAGTTPGEIALAVQDGALRDTLTTSERDVYRRA